MSFIMCESHKFTYPKKKATIQHCCEQSWFQNWQILEHYISEIDFFTIENYSISRQKICEIDYIQNFIYLFQEHQWKLVY